MKKITVTSFWTAAVFALTLWIKTILSGHDVTPLQIFAAPPLYFVMVWLFLMTLRLIYKAFKLATNERTHDVARGAFRVAKGRAAQKVDQLAELGRKDKP